MSHPNRDPLLAQLRTEGLLTVMVGTLLPLSYVSAEPLFGTVISDEQSMRAARDGVQAALRRRGDGERCLGHAHVALNQALLIVTGRAEGSEDLSLVAENVVETFQCAGEDVGYGHTEKFFERGDEARFSASVTKVARALRGSWHHELKRVLATGSVRQNGARMLRDLLHAMKTSALS